MKSITTTGSSESLLLLWQVFRGGVSLQSARVDLVVETRIHCLHAIRTYVVVT